LKNYNTHTASGAAEDVIRGLMHLVALEMHLKTDIEKLTSELELEDFDCLSEHLKKITQSRENSYQIARMRRSDMLRLYEMFDSKGDKSAWCNVKHMLNVAIVKFEVWQATGSNDDYDAFIDFNQLLNAEMARFIGVEITDCASCFSDMLKAEEVKRNEQC